MRVLSHRGYWKTDSEKNKEDSFHRSFTHGFGTETDIRDFNGELVISHDIAGGAEIRFEDFLKIVTSYSHHQSLTLALNIKSDGLASHICKIMKRFPNLDYFVFDMSVPDMRSYLNVDIPVFTRLSEVEQQPVWIENCVGIWVDCFGSEWASNSTIIDQLSSQKRVCLVSPELHKRNHLTFWERIRPIADHPLLMLCTDFPEEALNFFGSQSKGSA